MYEYLDYTSPLEFFEDVVIECNAKRPPDCQIRMFEVCGQESDPDVASPFDNVIIINPNFQTKFSLPFRQFHELQHVLNGEQHKTYAFKMLANFYFDENTDRYSKLYDFMAYFGIPMSLESAVLKNI